MEGPGSGSVQNDGSRMAKKHMDTTDPDPHHCLKVVKIVVDYKHIFVIFVWFCYNLNNLV
jgi:hypothetical protein